MGLLLLLGGGGGGYIAWFVLSDCQLLQNKIVIFRMHSMRMVCAQ